MRRAALVLTTAALLLGGSGAAAAAAGNDAAVSVREVSGAYVVAASFEVPWPAAVARDVLTDYANIPRFVPDVRSSTVIERADGRVRVEQEAVSKFIMFSRRVHLVLAVREERDLIVFVDECGRSFRRYAGSWRLREENGRTRIDYELTAQPAFEVPDFLVGRVLNRDAKSMIERLRAEMDRRAAGTR